MNSLYLEAVNRLSRHYSPGEARAMARVLLEDAFGVDINDIYADKVRQFSAEEADDFATMLCRLENNEPVQYVTGTAMWGNLKLHVEKGVLVPRPETLELAQWAAAECKAGTRILEIGTGSGCIAIFLAKNVENAHIKAVDISTTALEIARSNAAQLKADIDFAEADLFDPTFGNNETFDLIISNPPYVCESEKASMERNVLDYEPKEALFVSDEQPLVFYEAIAETAERTLAKHGCVMVEINRMFPQETAEVFSRHGFLSTQIRCDEQGNPRMIKAQRL